MSRPLLSKEKEAHVKGLIDLLQSTEKTTDEVVEIKRSSFLDLVGLAKLILSEKPIVIEEDLSPADAGDIANVSRPVIMHLYETGVLKGYPVKSQIRIKRESLMKYIEDRESFAVATRELDKKGYGI
jgi:hypothetical protein